MDIIKHISVFNPSRVGGKVAVIGVGALGSAVALQLAKLGLDLVLLDFDTVSAHNVANQVLYGPEDVSRLKVEAAADCLERLTGNRPETHTSKVSSRKDFMGCVAAFVCVDSMEQRTTIFNVSFCSTLQTFVEGRMGSSSGAVYLINPQDIHQRKVYKEELYPDEEVVHDAGVCGIIPSVVATATYLASLMVWVFINQINGKGEYNEVMVGLSPITMTKRRFDID